MYKIIGMLVICCFLGGATGHLQVTNIPKVNITDPSGYCSVYFGYYPTAEYKTPRYNVPITVIVMSCHKDYSWTSVIWRAEGVDHQIKLEWLGANKLKITHPMNLKIMHQMSTNEVEIEYDPPWEKEERKAHKKLDESEWPLKCDEAATYIYALLDEEDRQTVRETKKSDLINFHFSWGMGIRNSLGLWRGNDSLRKSCMQEENSSDNHPDTISMTIIRLVWEKTRNE